MLAQALEVLSGMQCSLPTLSSVERPRFTGEVPRLLSHEEHSLTAPSFGMGEGGQSQRTRSTDANITAFLRYHALSRARHEGETDQKFLGTTHLYFSNKTRHARLGRL